MRARFRSSRWLRASDVRRVLFVCARNRLRSRTAEVIFSEMEGVTAWSAGTAADADCPVSADLLEWADAIFVMERRQKTLLTRRFAVVTKGKEIVVLGIPDRYRYMQAELIALLRAKVLPLLRGLGPQSAKVDYERHREVVA